MLRVVFVVTCSMLIHNCSCTADEAARKTTVLNVWPGEVPGESTLDKQFLDQVHDKESGNKPDRVFGVTRPTLTYYAPAVDRVTDTGVIVCPGGGYNVLAWGHEGIDVARWLSSLGVHAFVLKYRVPRRSPDFKLPPLQDAQRAIRIVRSGAEEWGINSTKLGVLGFSAGGNLTVNAGTRYAEATYPARDEIDKINCRPDFIIPIYAAYLGDADSDQQLDGDLQINRDTPPTFMAVTQDDKNRGMHAALLFAELTRVGVEAELHVFSKGGHGYGLRPGPNAVSHWPDRCEDWMRASGFLPVR